MLSDKNVLEMFKRIKNGPEGVDFIAYLEELTSQNYRAWKKSGRELSDVHKGYAMAVDSLLESFTKCEQPQQQLDVDPTQLF